RADGPGRPLRPPVHDAGFGLHRRGGGRAGGRVTQTSVYEAAGGEAAFTRLIDRFYDAVAVDPVLRPLYPDDPEQFAAAREHLRLFLIQYWGGPGWYSERRGHPRLRMRHAPFAI